MANNTHYCAEHNIAFTRHEKDGESWYSHRVEGGAYHNEPKTAFNSNTSHPEEKPKQSWSKSPEETKAIQRQHSQEMSLMFVGLLVQTKQITEVTRELVDKYTDHFEQNIPGTDIEF